LAEYAASGPPSSPQKEYGYRNGQLLVTAESSANIHYLVADQLGTPRMILDQCGSLANVSRHDYLPFGEELYAGVGGRLTTQGYTGDSTRHKFTGKERDIETGLDFFEARYYGGSQGRFTSPDDFLNDTHVYDPASWNLYAYVRNNPLRYTDPYGEEVHNNNLTVDEQNALIVDWRTKTGYQNIYFDKKTNNLVIDTSAGFKGGSAEARKQLSDAVGATDKIFDLVHSNTDPNVLFAETKGTLSSVDGQGKRIETYEVKIDFDDFKHVSGDKSAIESYSIGIAALHEFDHNLYGPVSDKPNSLTDPGPVENRFINPIRRELGLPERENYVGQPTSSALKPFFPNGGSELRFKNAEGKEKYLRWRDDVVGKQKN